ncbi:hypothetical protein HZ994_06720 [Akkermansiaceae bacterium]|nr:hypothetical protein HZ994_06720 [Akkermansiaceae bacterium]
MAFAPCLVAEPASTATPGGTRDSAPKVRLVFLSTLAQDEVLVLASPGEDGKWTEHGELKARPSFITDWLEVPAGETHLTRRTPEGLVSKGKFNVPPRARSVLAVIVADPAAENYRSKVIDPAKQGFARGSTLVMNLSKNSALVVLGGTRLTVEPAATKVSKATPEANGMYRMLAGYKDKDDKLVVCYDRYVSSDSKAREFLFLLPDENTGLRVLSLPEFGDVD